MSKLEQVTRVNLGAEGSRLGLASPWLQAARRFLPTRQVALQHLILHLRYFIAQRTHKLNSVQVKYMEVNTGKSPKDKLLKYLAQEE